MMKVRYKKQRGKRNTLSCVRTDSTSTWTSIHPGLEIHDLAHYVVESELGFDHAFFGTLNKGFDIQDYTKAREERPDELLPVNLHVQALQAEHFINLLQVDHLSTQPPQDLLEILSGILKENGLPLPTGLDIDTLRRIKSRLSELFGCWQALPVGKTLELDFPDSKQ